MPASRFVPPHLKELYAEGFLFCPSKVDVQAPCSTIASFGDGVSATAVVSCRFFPYRPKWTSIVAVGDEMPAASGRFFSFGPESIGSVIKSGDFLMGGRI